MVNRDRVSRAGSLKLFLATTSGIVGVALAPLASAQTAADEEPAVETSEGIQDIVVTAQRRDESAQRAALSISVIGGDELKSAGIVSPDDLTRIAPGIQVSGGTSTQVYVRGIGDFGATAQANAAVVTNIDGVVVSRPQAFAGNLFDIQRVELLKGPQGTLYGRNASGGVLNLITVKPEFGRLGGYVEGTVGNYSQLGTEGALNVPTGDYGALRLSYQVNDRHGYLSDGTDDDEHESVRLQGRFEPTPRLETLVSLSYTHLGGKGAGLVRIPRIPGLSPWSGTSSEAVADDLIAAATAQFIASGGASMPPFLLDPLSSFGVSQDVKSYAAHAQLDYDADFATLTIIPAWRQTKARFAIAPNFHYNPGGVPYNAQGDSADGERSDQYSLEMRLGNESNRLKWVLGGYWFKEDQSTDYQLRAGIPLNTRNIMSLTTEAYAAFGQLTYSLLDQLRATVGLRYTSDKRSAYDFERYAISPMMLGGAPSPLDCDPANGAPIGTLCPVSNLTPGYYDSSKTFEKLTWKAGLEFDVTPDSLLFADVSRGFKAGGFNQSVDLVDRSTLLPFDPETVTAYTIGSKNRFLGNQLQINLEAFYYDYKNMQLSSAGFDGDNQIVLITRNAGGATIKGVNLDIVAIPWANGRLRGAVEYVDTNYDRFDILQPAQFVPPGRVACPVSPPDANGNVVINCAGFPLVRAPDWTATVGYTHIFDMNSGATVTFDSDLNYAAESWLATDFHPTQLAPDYVNISASLTYTAPDDRWFVSAWIRNLTNEAIYTGGGGNQNGFVNGWSTSSIAPPRTYGVRFGVNF